MENGTPSTKLDGIRLSEKYDQQSTNKIIKCKFHILTPRNINKMLPRFKERQESSKLEINETTYNSTTIQLPCICSGCREWSGISPRDGEDGEK